jgi:aminoglycoside 3-N-acetyltransferase
MREASIIEETPEPRTRASLARALHRIGLTSGEVVLVHSSLSAIGWVCGGAVAVIQALMDVLTSEGTLVMPAHSGDLSEPSHWENPPVPEAWWGAIRETMPAYDPRYTPTRGIGRIAEAFRSWPDVRRSNHPTASFAAWGARAERVTEGHALSNDMGETSPLARIYDLDGWVLLLGVGYKNNSSFHLAEYRVPGGNTIEHGSPILENGRRVWKTYDDIDLDDEPFDAIGADFERRHSVRKGRVGSAESRFFSQRAAVDFAVDWLSQRREDDL